MDSSSTTNQQKHHFVDDPTAHCKCNAKIQAQVLITHGASNEE
jgi:hypothetical protein